MYERTTGRCRFYHVQNRDADNLEEIVIKNVSKNSKLVITDGWKGYATLKNCGYEHIKYREFLEHNGSKSKKFTRI